MKGFKHGKGVYIYENGDEYSGEWREGLKEGKGEFKYKYSSDSYLGDWVRNVKNG